MSPDPITEVTSSRNLLARKILTGFLIGFGAYFLPELLGILDTVRDGGEVAFGWSLIGGLISGAAGGGIRAALALGPWNLAGPTDALHTLGKERPTTVTVTEPPA